jgi:hypothetical protein
MLSQKLQRSFGRMSRRLLDSRVDNSTRTVRSPGHKRDHDQDPPPSDDGKDGSQFAGRVGANGGTTRNLFSFALASNRGQRRYVDFFC